MTAEPPESFADTLPRKRIFAVKVLVVSIAILLMFLPLIAVFTFVIPLRDLVFTPGILDVILVTAATIFGLGSLRIRQLRARRNVDEFIRGRNPRELVDSELASNQPGELTVFLTNEFLKQQAGASLSLWLSNSILVTSLLVIPSALTLLTSCFLILVSIFQIPTYGRHKRWMQKCLLRNKDSFEHEVKLS